MTEFKNNTTMTEADVENFVNKWNDYCDTGIFETMTIYEKQYKVNSWDLVNGFRKFGWNVKINPQNCHLTYCGRL